MLKQPIILGTRGSELALWQAHHIQNELNQLGWAVEIKIIKTKGDKIQDLSFDKIEGKGFFTKELQDALLSNEIDIMSANPGVFMSHIKAGRLRPIAVSSAQRLPIFPDLPTYEEMGFPGYVHGSWYGLVAPARTPAADAPQCGHTRATPALPPVRAQPRPQSAPP
jgi:hypothetical protein